MSSSRSDRKRQSTSKLTAHRGLATWGERLVPLAEFRQATATRGQRLSEKQRGERRQQVRAARPSDVPTEGPFERVAVFGGIYSNHLALTALIDDARERGAEALFCLGDLGGFGPSPEKVWPLLEKAGVKTIQGNYEESLASGREDCNCGYTDPRDNHFARISYDYTERHSSQEFKEWMGTLPSQRRLRIGDREILLAHGSPRRINDFLFDSTAPDAHLELLLEQYDCQGLLVTHSGLHWHRRLPGGGDVINVGVIGRPANDGRTEVWYSLIENREGRLAVGLVPLAYDHLALADEMRSEGLPEEFVETILTGWWTTCLEILPAKERSRSRY